MLRPDQRAIVLFAHGARDARWSATLGELRAKIERRCPQATVAAAFLEFQPPGLREALAAVIAAGCRRVDVLPVFWASGGHVADDLPPLLGELRGAHPEVEIRLLPVLSELPGLLDFVAETVASLPPDTGAA